MAELSLGIAAGMVLAATASATRCHPAGQLELARAALTLIPPIFGQLELAREVRGDSKPASHLKLARELEAVAANPVSQLKSGGECEPPPPWWR